MSGMTVDEKKLRYMEYIHRETGTRHHTNEEDMRQYEMLRAGDPGTVAEAERMFASGLAGRVSDDPVRNCKYLFVASVTMACRTAMAAGMEPERAYNSSDLFIQRMDRLDTVEDICRLRREMFEFYLKEVRAVPKRTPYSRPVARCVDYIYEHLHQRITLPELAEQAGLTQNYLSALFKKETGRSVSDYVMDKRIEAAGNMLKFSDYSCADIGAILAFSSQSHFIRAFKARTGQTPRAWREKFFET